MDSFFNSPLCNSRTRCRECRTNNSYRKGIVIQFDEPVDVEFACPHGVTVETLPPGPEPRRPIQNDRRLRKDVARNPPIEVKKVSTEEYDRRMTICGGCGNFKNGRCKKCGCGMKFKAKTERGKCPEDKW